MKKLIILTLICFFSITSVCFAGDLKLPGGKWWRLPKVVKELKLTGVEQDKLDALFVASRRKLIDLKNNVEKEKFELELTLENVNFDDSACMNQFKKLQNARTSLAEEQFRFIVEVRKLLGLDRYQQLIAKSRENRMKRMKGWSDLRGRTKKKSF